MTTQSTNKAGDPGLSLWLVPPTDSAIYKALNNAIVHVVPPILDASDSPPQFEPHVTLTSRISRQTITTDPQKWLDELDLPAISAAEVKFQELAVGDTFTKKLFIRCERRESLLELAASCRKHSSSESDGADYDPHVSLVYSKESVGEDAKRLVGLELAENDVHVDGFMDYGCHGWKGGSVWLVPTDGDVANWRPIARRD